jgi:hypothetical protein
MKTGGNQYLVEPGTVFSPTPPIHRFQTRQLKSNRMSAKNGISFKEVAHEGTSNQNC